MIAKEHPEYLTVTCLEWKHVLREDRIKDVIVESLRYLSKVKRIVVYGFVIMSNHFHLIWHMLGDHKREDVQRDFLKYTSHQILKVLRSEHAALLDELMVNAKDRKYQVWERKSLGVSLWSSKVFEQKLTYIHYNPVKAGLCQFPEEYKYSSAGFYMKQLYHWDFIVHYEGGVKNQRASCLLVENMNRQEDLRFR